MVGVRTLRRGARTGAILTVGVQLFPVERAIASAVPVSSALIPLAVVIGLTALFAAPVLAYFVVAARAGDRRDALGTGTFLAGIPLVLYGWWTGGDAWTVGLLVLIGAAMGFLTPRVTPPERRERRRDASGDAGGSGSSVDDRSPRDGPD